MIVNILLYHLFLNPAGIALAILVTIVGSRLHAEGVR